ncbi:MAG: hypothetical protein AAFX54_14995 [Pseudomonadota bacterium]
MKRVLSSAAGVAALFGAAIAGSVQPFPVDVDLTAGSAEGDMVTARYAGKENEYIGCGIRKFDDGAGGATAFGFCQAEDAAGERGFCNTDNEDLLDAISSSAAFSFVTFNWDKEGRCTRIGFSNQSLYLPKGLGANL